MNVEVGQPSVAAMEVGTRLRARLRRAEQGPTLLLTSTFLVRSSIFKEYDYQSAH